MRKNQLRILPKVFTGAIENVERFSQMVKTARSRWAWRASDNGLKGMLISLALQITVTLQDR